MCTASLRRFVYGPRDFLPSQCYSVCPSELLGFIEAAAMTLVVIPISFETLIVYSVVLHFVVELQASASQFL